MGVVWDLHMIDTINAVVKQAYISVTMPRGLVFSYTSLDSSEMEYQGQRWCSQDHIYHRI